MLFSSSIFLFCFLPLCLISYYLIPMTFRKMRNLLLFLASLGFYAWGEPIFVVIMIISILANYIFALLVDKYSSDNSKSKLVMVLMIMFNLGIFFIFKYVGFFVSNINHIFGLNMIIPKIALPIGISFFTFQAISYVIDVYRKKDEEGDTIYAQRNPINVGLYIALFPQLIAGPIVRYKSVAFQIESRVENFNDFSEGVKRFIIGLSKKVLISNNMAIIAEQTFLRTPSEISISFAWLGAIAYTLQIFFDFAGYSDMAIGLGKMFGFHFLENFNYPYVSKSISEFWRRWHISLGSWFRDYVYFPLGGSRKGKARTIGNLAVVWLLTGVWHGANWTFIVWGIYFFVFIAVEKLIVKKNRSSNKKYGIEVLKHIYVLFVLVFGWVLFRSESLTYAVEYMKTMIGINGVGITDDLTILYLKENIWFIAAGILFSIPISSKIGNIYRGFRKYTKLVDSIVIHYIYQTAYVCTYSYMFLVSISYLVKGAYNPFIYFNF